MSVSGSVTVDQASSEHITEGAPFGSSDHAHDELGEAVSQDSLDHASSSVGVGGPIGPLNVGAGVEHENGTITRYLTAVDRLPTSPDRAEEFLEQRRDATLADVEAIADIDWRKLQSGEGVSVQEFAESGTTMSLGYRFIDVALGSSTGASTEVSAIMGDDGQLSLRVASSESSEVGASITLGDLPVVGGPELSGSSTATEIDQVTVTVDTTTPEGVEAADQFFTYGLLPGAIELLPEERRAELAALMELGDADGATRPDPEALATLVQEANDQVLGTVDGPGDAEANGRADELPTADGGPIQYEEVSAGRDRSREAQLSFAGVDLMSESESSLVWNRNYNEGGSWLTEYGSRESEEHGGLFGLGAWDASTAVAVNPEDAPGTALYATVEGSEWDDRVSLSLTDAGLEAYAEALDATGAAERALFTESASDFYFDPRYGGQVTDADGEYATYLDGNGEGVLRPNDSGVDHEFRGDLGMSGVLRERAIENMAETYGVDLSDPQARADMLLGYSDVIDEFESMAAGEIAQTMHGVTDVAGYLALDPADQALYAAMSANRMRAEPGTNPADALGLVFALPTGTPEERAVRDEVLRDALTHMAPDTLRAVIEATPGLAEDAGIPELAAAMIRSPNP